MGKWLFLILLLLVVYLAVKAGHRAARAKEARANSAALAAQTMVACKRCGLHLPKEEALEVDGRFYCCQDHGASDSV
jgi:uncharacterized protein